MIATARRLQAVDAIDLDDLLESWLVQLRARTRALTRCETVEKRYAHYLKFCDDNEFPREWNKATVWRSWPRDGAQASSRRAHASRAENIRQGWIADEEGLDASGVLSVKPPKTDQRVVADLPR